MKRKRKKKKQGISAFIGPIILILLALVVAGFINVFGRSFLSQMKSFFDVVFYLYIISACLVIFFEERNPNRMIAWLLVLVLFPGLGLVAYLAFGRSFRKKKRVKDKKMDKVAEPLQRIEERHKDYSYDDLPTICQSLIKLLKTNSDAKLMVHNEVKVLADGLITFSLMFEAIERARSIVNVEFFIVKGDDLGNRFRELLIKKAEEGVEVNFLYDAVGSWRLSSHYKETLMEAGVNVKEFLPVIAPFITRNMNYRNHRKILTIDGEVGFVGGLNIGDEYIGKKEQFGYWRDTHLMIKGEGVCALNYIFAEDWSFAGGKIRDNHAFYPPITEENYSLMQIASSGPDSDKQVIKQAYFKMIAMAKESVYIESPYLVPEDSLLVALKTAALSGVDVKGTITANSSPPILATISSLLQVAFNTLATSLIKASPIL
jgi:cardiolipin synthase